MNEDDGVVLFEHAKPISSAKIEGDGKSESQADGLVRTECLHIYMRRMSESDDSEGRCYFFESLSGSEGKSKKGSKDDGFLLQKRQLMQK